MKVEHIAQKDLSRSAFIKEVETVNDVYCFLRQNSYVLFDARNVHDWCNFIDNLSENGVLLNLFSLQFDGRLMPDYYFFARKDKDVRFPYVWNERFD